MSNAAPSSEPAAVAPIPEGQPTITPYLSVEGAAEAIAFYTQVFGAQEQSRLPGPDGARLMHAQLRIGNSLLYLSDACPEMGGPRDPKGLGGSPVSIHLYVENVDDTLERAVQAGAAVEMPPADMFWGDRFAKITDPFGHSWSLATRKEVLTEAQIQERFAQFMAQQEKA